MGRKDSVQVRRSPETGASSPEHVGGRALRGPGSCSRAEGSTEGMPTAGGSLGSPPRPQGLPSARPLCGLQVGSQPASVPSKGAWCQLWFLPCSTVHGVWLGVWVSPPSGHLCIPGGRSRAGPW